MIGHIGGDFAFCREVAEEDLNRNELHPQTRSGEPVIEPPMSQVGGEMRELNPRGHFDPVSVLGPSGKGFE